jgi:hypothetical protein
MLLSLTTIFSIGLTLEFKEKEVYNILPDDRSYFDVYGRLDLFIFYVNVPFASNNYYLNDFSQIVINPNKEFSFDDMYVGINIIKRNIGIFPLRLSVESKIPDLSNYNNYLLTLESGINFGRNFNFEIGYIIKLLILILNGFLGLT